MVGEKRDLGEAVRVNRTRPRRALSAVGPRAASEWARRNVAAR